MRIVKWGSVTICKTNVLKDTILNFLKIVTEITLGIPSISPLNQNVTMNILSFFEIVIYFDSIFINKLVSRNNFKVCNCFLILICFENIAMV